MHDVVAEALAGPWFAVLYRESGKLVSIHELQADGGPYTVSVVRGTAVPIGSRIGHPSSRRPDDILYQVGGLPYGDVEARWYQALTIAAALSAAQARPWEPAEQDEPAPRCPHCGAKGQQDQCDITTFTDMARSETRSVPSALRCPTPGCPNGPGPRLTVYPNVPAQDAEPLATGAPIDPAVRYDLGGKDVTGLVQPPGLRRLEVVSHNGVDDRDGWAEAVIREVPEPTMGDVQRFFLNQPVSDGKPEDGGR